MVLYESILSETTEREFVEKVLRESASSRIASEDERHELSDRVSREYSGSVHPVNWVLHEGDINWGFLEALVRVYGTDVASRFVNLVDLRMESNERGLKLRRRAMNRFEELHLAYPAAHLAMGLGIYEKASELYERAGDLSMAVDAAKEGRMYERAISLLERKDTEGAYEAAATLAKRLGQSERAYDLLQRAVYARPIPEGFVPVDDAVTKPKK